VRLRLVGYSGPRPPVPGTEPVDPIDPNPEPDPPPDPGDVPPPLVVVLNNGDVFRKADYLALGYNRFDVMCIGAAGGHAGTIKQIIPDSGPHSQNAQALDYDLYWNSYRYIFGGAGGGGGVHRIKGRLALLPTNVPVVVGQPGADGAYSEVNAPFHDWRSGDGGYAAAPQAPAGADGGMSSFGGTICRASGGKGGVSTDGGAGGIGNVDGAGGGPTPAYNAGSFNPVTGQTTVGSMNPGKWDGKIGSGGAGGRGTMLLALKGEYARGGAGHAEDVRGADGAYLSTEPSVSGKGAAGVGFGFDYTRITSEIIYPTDGQNPYFSGYNMLVGARYDASYVNPGAGGGAKPFMLNGENKQYGSKAPGAEPNGLVIVRLSFAIV
jgi:hypothetical protein